MLQLGKLDSELLDLLQVAFVDYIVQMIVHTRGELCRSLTLGLSDQPVPLD